PQPPPQVPSLQNSPAAQVIPQPPQLSGSYRGSTQSPEHSVSDPQAPPPPPSVPPSVPVPGPRLPSSPPQPMTNPLAIASEASQARLVHFIHPSNCCNASVISRSWGNGRESRRSGCDPVRVNAPGHT